MEFIENALKRARANCPKDDVLVRDFKVTESDQVVGELPQELRGLYAVLRESSTAMEALQNEAREEARALMDSFETRTPKDLRAAVDALGKKTYGPINDNKILRDMFWSCVYRALPELIGNPNIGVREGWKVVISVPEEPEIVSISLSELFGGDISGHLRPRLIRQNCVALMPHTNVFSNICVWGFLFK